MRFLKRLFTKQEPVNEPVPEGSHGTQILNFQNIISHRIEFDELASAEFAMWMPSEKDQHFSDSAIIATWTEIYKLTANYWSYIAADLLKTLHVIGEDDMQIALPESSASYAFVTADSEQILLSLSAEKGIRFHFASTTPLESRLSFLENFRNYCKGWEGLVTKLNQPKDEDTGFAEWWALTVKASKTAELQGPVKAVGKIITK